MSESAPPKRSKKLRILIIAVVAVLVVGFLLAAVAPAMLSTGAGRSFIVSQINASIPGSVTIDDLSLSWGGPQRITGFTANLPDGEPFLTIKQIDAADLSLWAVARGSRDFGVIKIDGIDGTLAQYEDESTNISRAFVSDDAPAEEKPADQPAPKTRIEWTNANLTVTAPGVDPVDVRDFEGFVDLNDLAAIDLAMVAKVRQGDAAGSIDARATLTNLLDQSMNVTLADAAVDADVKIKDLPVVAIDRIAQQGGILTTLLGPVLNAEVKANGKLASADFAAVVTASSRNLTQCDLRVGYVGGNVTVEPQSGLTLNITPDAWRQLIEGRTQQPATLAQAFTVRVAVNDLAVATAMTSGKADVNVAVDDIILDAADQRIGRVALRGTTLTMRSDNIAEAIQVVLDTVAEQGGQRGTVHADATLNNVIAPPEAEVKPSYTIDAKVTNTPLAVFDQLMATDGTLVDALGPTADATINGNYDEANATGGAVINIQSANLTADFTAKADDTQVAVSKGTIDYTLTPALANRYMGEEPTATLIDPVKVNLTVNSLTIPRDGDKFDMNAGKANVKLVSEDIKFNDGQQQPLVFRKPSADLVSDSLAEKFTLNWSTVAARGSRAGEIKGRAIVEQAFTDAGAFNATGMKADVQLATSPQIVGSIRPLSPVDAVVGAVTESPFTMRLNLQMVEPSAAAEMAATFLYELSVGDVRINAPGKVDGKRLVLDDKTTAEFTVDQAMLDALVKSDQTPAYTLAAPAKVKLEVKKFDLIVAGDDLGRGPVDIGVNSAALRLASTQTSGSTIDIKKLSASIKADDLRQLVNAAGSANVTTAGQSADVTFAAAVADVMNTAEVKQASLKAPAMPTALVDALTTGTDQYTRLLGDTLAIDVTAQPQGEATAFNADVKSANLDVKKLTGTYEAGKQIRIDGDARATYTLTPVAFAAMRKESGDAWALKSPAAINLQLQQPATIGLKPDGGVNYNAVSMQMSVATGDIVLTRGSESYPLTGLQAQVEAPNLAQAIVVKAAADFGSGQLTSNTRIDKPVNAAGELDIVNAAIATDTTASDMPAVMLDALAASEGQIAQLFGPTVAAQAKGNYPGNLDVTVKGELGEVDLPLSFDNQRVLTLQRDGLLHFTATKELAETVLKNINPILSDAVSSADPIRIDVRQAGTRIPLANFDINQAQAAALVSLGTVQLSEGGFMGQLRSVLGKSSRDGYAAAFSPTTVTLQSGWVSYQDMVMDIVDEKLKIYFDGRVHVDPNSAREVDMTATIPGDVLAASVKELRGIVGPNEGLTIPIRGTIDNPKPDMGGFKKSIADMIIKGGIRKGIGEALGGDDKTGEAAGAIFEGIFGGKKK